MSKKYIMIFLVLLILVLAGGTYFWKTKMQKSTTEKSNLIENEQSANPYDKTNPFSNIKVNPFE